MTLIEVFGALAKILNRNLELIKKALANARVMVNFGTNITKESQLSRADVLQIIHGKAKAMF